MSNKLSEAEENALELIKRDGCLLASRISDRTDLDVFGNVIPGMAVFKKLEKKGLIFFTEEEPLILDDGTEFYFTPLVYLTEEINHER